MIKRSVSAGDCVPVGTDIVLERVNMLKSLIERKLEQYEYKNPSYALIERDKRVNIDSNNSSRYRGSGEKWSSVAGKSD